MNTSHYTSYINQLHTTLKEVCLSDETAFIGKCGNGPDHALYMICDDIIFEASNPTSFWSSPNCSVIVNRYVDLDIDVREKCK